ncbi:MAG: aminotransferase class I/II-fold pyridoxal phosphate-dependent enzyme [Planctomycetes bacterium]|nr:aminotransferase class I/II-fold pyridoxal phosphate-dependent enzyme [Planctomycetota bacterium]
MSPGITVNQNIAEMEYAVRGPIPQRAAELRRQGKRTIPCNIGNPQGLGQQPISYYRQVLSLLEAPSKIARERRLNKLRSSAPAAFAGLAADDFVSDYILDLCDEMLAKFETGLGAYTESKGPLFIREAIARFIDTREDAESSGAPRSDPEHIFLTNGASEAGKNLVDLLIADRRDGLMIPTPQYPLYSAAIRRAGGCQVNYYLDEDSGWTLNRSMLEEALAAATRDGVAVKAIVVINPGNPTGAVLPKESIREVVDFAGQHGLAIIADEVYQDNTYGATFVSFAQTVGSQDVPLFSLHSTSKGFCGECGRRGGYVEVRNPPAVTNTSLSFMDLLLKQASVSLCSNTIGQALTYLMVCPPAPDSAPHKQFVEEKKQVLEDLYNKAALIRAAFAEMNGVECFGRTGAMYLFPRLNRLPAGTTDFDYCMSLLEAVGLCTVNGSGFGQRAGTNHLRVAFLPSRELLEEVLPRWVEFHNAYVNRKQ